MGETIVLDIHDDNSIYIKDFATDSVDILNVDSMIQKYYPIEVDKLLLEYKRILRKGGKITLEQPDLYKCCANVLRKMSDPTDAEVFYNQGQLQLFGIYTPSQQNLVHKWCWDVAALTQAVANAGFVNIKEVTPAPSVQTTHFRLEATKSE